MKNLTEYQLLVLEKDSVSCEDVEALMGDYVADELTQTLETRLSAHIRSCDCCKELERDYNLTIELANEIGKSREQAPQGVHVRLRAALNRELGLEMPLAPVAN